MSARVFWAHGEFCATHPWEVIVATFTLTICMLTVDYQQHSPPPPKPAVPYCIGCLNEAEYNAADVIVMTLIRCLAVLYSYYQFCHLQRLGCKYILGIAGLFTVSSSFVFTSTVLNFLHINVSDLKDALFFFLLLIDLSKAAILAEFALSASSQDEVKINIARGMSLLGPTITLDTIVETLVIGVGTLSGVYRLEMLSYFACLSVIVNYAVFMTFYPACLSLILELSRISNIYGTRDIRSSLISRVLKEEDQKSNPIVQRVKQIMSVGLVVVHGLSRLPSQKADDSIDTLPPRMPLNRTEDAALHGYIMRWVTLSADHIVILILLLALAVKFVFFENTENFELRVRMAEQQRAASKMRVHAGYSGLLPDMTRFLKISEFDESLNNKEVQTDDVEMPLQEECRRRRPDDQYEASPTENTVEKFAEDEGRRPMRSLDECLNMYKNKEELASKLSDEEVIQLVDNKLLPAYKLEAAVKDCERGIGIRRKIIGASGGITQAIADLPYKNYDYEKVMGACCENVIGYMPVPVGVAGPLVLDERPVYLPMATTEGCLVASTNRGCRALARCGVTSRVISEGMTRAPVVRFPTMTQASEVVAWLDDPKNFAQVKADFETSSRYAKLLRTQTRIFGRLVYIRFVASTGDAMGMNMISNGTEVALKKMQAVFPSMEIVSVSGNLCTDKKPSAVNWIEGRGKYVVCEAIVPKSIVENVLKTHVDALVDLNVSKNLIGSAAAGSIGGFNAHAANIVTAMYIATGQDPAQNVGSSNCMTIMERGGTRNEDLYISCTMPSIEVGTIGGGTNLQPQGACLAMLGVRGGNLDHPGSNATQLARIICGAVLAGELSLMSALSAGQLVESHLKHNRSSTTERVGSVEMASTPTPVHVER